MTTAPDHIAGFKRLFLNSEGLVSRTFPASERTIFDHFDDLAPFFEYFGETEFLLEQVSRLPADAFVRLLPVGNILYSYLIDEYLGGLNWLHHKTSDPKVRALRDSAVIACKQYFMQGDELAEFYDLNSCTASPYSSPWSSGLLETFLEMHQDYPGLVALVEQVVQGWLANPFYIEHGLFPYRSTRKRPLFLLGQLNARRRAYAEHCPTTALTSGRPISLRHRVRERLRKMRYLYATSGHYVQLMKSNTSLVFTMIQLHQLGRGSAYRVHINRWLESCWSKMVDSGMVCGLYYPGGSPARPSLADAFILIDVLCDTYWFVDRDPHYITRAIAIADAQLATSWQNGLLPITKGADRDHLDNQVDFAVSLRRIGDISGDKKWLEYSRRLIESALRIHRCRDGFCTQVDGHGQPIELQVNTIDPKYNALALKAFILMEEESASIYGNSGLWEILKDR